MGKIVTMKGKITAIMWTYFPKRNNYVGTRAAKEPV